MNIIPENISNITRNGCVFIDSKFNRNILYTINEKEKDQTNINIELTPYGRKEKTDVIIEDSNNFVNGFKVVKTENGEYAYVREIDNYLLPYRYDIASNFNEYGFAIVAKNEGVSWIDKNFNYLSSNGQMIKERLNTKYQNFSGLYAINDFSKGDIPLSIVTFFNGKNRYYCYFGIDGKIKEFYKYDGEKIDKSFPRIYFKGNYSFNEKGYTITDSEILFANGYFISKNDLIKISINNGILELISGDIENNIDNNKESKKALAKTKEKNNL